MLNVAVDNISNTHDNDDEKYETNSLEISYILQDVFDISTYLETNVRIFIFLISSRTKKYSTATSSLHNNRIKLKNSNRLILLFLR